VLIKVIYCFRCRGFLRVCEYK